MKCFVKSAEDKIKDAAMKIFLEKGFDGATIRDIAKEAGMNSALMNYYFRSKENLFNSVFSEKCQLFFEGIQAILNQPISLKEKIAKIIDHDFELFTKNPALASFVLTELHKNPERLNTSTDNDKCFQNILLDKQISGAIQSGIMRNIDSKNIMMLISSNVHSVFQNKTLYTKMWGLSEESYAVLVNKHKEIIKQMIVNYLFYDHTIEMDHPAKIINQK